jgi:cold shock protein
MPVGEVQWFNIKKGFGFIRGPDGTDLFVHHKDIEAEGFRRLDEGDRVEYEPVQTDKGPKAQRVRKLPGREAE